MLETKGLYKIYKPKRGVPVTALKNVNIRFPDRGMVFLLGKSGSGKSTLLNVLGGLDQYNKGEIIIKGVSSKAFKQKHFDSYRNTYVGFIFQEYNVLEEFTVGANIALALQLQGKKATDDAINEILNEVDLTGFGGRRPNELSGGQKQRVAIARALVKKPEIIMADEPTGALDSATGKQVLETLKKLSKKHLVIVVSHDREFAEQYADRIIELADGQVIRDVERTAEVMEAAQPLTFSESGVEVQKGYQLTEEDRLAINQYLAELESGSFTIRQKQKASAGFAPTDLAKIPHRDGASFKLIKSKLPMKNAFKIGGSGLKHKKIRLTVTILLSCVAFGLFGLSDTFGAYNHIKTCTESMIDTGITYTSIAKSKYIEEFEYWQDYGYNLKEEDLSSFEEETGVHLKGVYQPIEEWSFSENLKSDANITENEAHLYRDSFTGIAAITEKDLEQMNYSLIAGRMPEGEKNEIAVSQYVAEVLIERQYTQWGKEEYPLFSGPKAIEGITLRLAGTDYTVVGIVDTKMDLERYEVLAEEETNLSTAEELVRYALEQEFAYASNYSLARVAMVSSETFDRMVSQDFPVITTYRCGLDYSNEYQYLPLHQVGKLSDFTDQIIWVDGVVRERLANNELVVSSDVLTGSFEPGTMNFTEAELADLAKEQGPFEGHIYLDSYREQEDLGKEVRIVGVVDVKGSENASFAVYNDDLFARMTDGGDGPYQFAVGGLPAEKSAFRQMVEYCYEEEGGYRLPLQNSVTYELDLVHESLQVLAKWFFYIGVGFALFAALMLSNFIATSISYKKQEIGILRAIGSRSSDVFRIFFSESFIIAMINFMLSCAGVAAATAVVNHLLRRSGILITVLNFGIRQMVLLFLVSILVAAVASFFPVKRIASKKPIDAIRNR
ncbi:MAG: ABC transporter ATP-binding protein/permease [Clostridia bacterium]|nr:ABC transporter ATP-binding protein/permease [Clostridia bacterium]